MLTLPKNRPRAKQRAREEENAVFQLMDLNGQTLCDDLEITGLQPSSIENRRRAILEWNYFQVRSVDIPNFSMSELILPIDPDTGKMLILYVLISFVCFFVFFRQGIQG